MAQIVKKVKSSKVAKALKKTFVLDLHKTSKDAVISPENMVRCNLSDAVMMTNLSPSECL